MSVTMREVHDWLRERREPAMAQEVSAKFWPKQHRVRTGHGPTRGTTIALYMLGRMEQRGMVFKQVPGGLSRGSPSRWLANFEWRPAAVIRPSTCANCACPRSGHLDSAPRSCLKHLECEDYQPLGKERARLLAGGAP